MPCCQDQGPAPVPIDDEDTLVSSCHPPCPVSPRAGARPAVVHSPSGRRIELSAQGSLDRITVHGPSGELIARIEVDEAGVQCAGWIGW